MTFSRASATIFLVEAATFVWQWILMQIPLWIISRRGSNPRTFARCARGIQPVAACITILACLHALLDIFGEPLSRVPLGRVLRHHSGFLRRRRHSLVCCAVVVVADNSLHPFVCVPRPDLLPPHVLRLASVVHDSNLDTQGLTNGSCKPGRRHSNLACSPSLGLVNH